MKRREREGPADDRTNSLPWFVAPFCDRMSAELPYPTAISRPGRRPDKYRKLRTLAFYRTWWVRLQPGPVPLWNMCTCVCSEDPESILPLVWFMHTNTCGFSFLLSDDLSHEELEIILILNLMLILINSSFPCLSHGILNSFMRYSCPCPSR